MENLKKSDLWKIIKQEVPSFKELGLSWVSTSKEEMYKILQELGKYEHESKSSEDMEIKEEEPVKPKRKYTRRKKD